MEPIQINNTTNQKTYLFKITKNNLRQFKTTKNNLRQPRGNLQQPKIF